MIAPAIETVNLQLLPNAPEHLLALIESEQRYEERFGLRAADGLRAFYVSGDLSPDFLEKLHETSGPDPWNYGFAVVHRETRSVIGVAGFKGSPDDAGMVEIAYGIVPIFQRRGFATEAAQALVAYAARDDRVRLVRAHTLPTPNASTRVLTKCGFKFVGPVVDPEDGPVWRWERPSASHEIKDS